MNSSVGRESDVPQGVGVIVVNSLTSGAVPVELRWTRASSWTKESCIIYLGTEPLSSLTLTNELDLHRALILDQQAI